MPGFNTLNYVNTLETAGVPSLEAQAHAKAFNDAMTYVKTNLATVNDLRETEQRLMTEILSTERKLVSFAQSIATT